MSIQQSNNVLEHNENHEDLLQLRRLQLLRMLEHRVKLSNQVEILHNLQMDKSAAFVMSDSAAESIRAGLQDKRRLRNESTALGHLSVAAQTPDSSGIVYKLDALKFENIGVVDHVIASERESLGVGEVEIHTHVYSRPMYLDNTDVADVITAVAGPAWVDPYKPHSFNRHMRVFGIISIHWHGLARLQFYCHNLEDDLSAQNNFGLKKFGNPIVLLSAF